MPAAVEQFSDGSAAFFSNREVPWHGLGQIVDGAQTAEDALRLAQLDWTVYKSEEPVQVPVLTANGVVMVSAEDKYLTYRDHPKTGLSALGVVGEAYTVIQNSEQFDFLNALVDEGGAVFETAGSLNGGRQVFVSMKMPSGVTLGNGTDTVDMYLMVTTSHNGTRAFTAAVSPIRPVCQNTVQLALASAASSWSLKHTTNVKGKLQQARAALDLVFKYEEAFDAAVQELVSQEMSDKQFVAFTDSLIKMPANPTLRQANKVDNVKAELRELWHAPTQKIVANTRWAAFNAVTEWADWVKPLRAGKRDENEVRGERYFTDSNAGLRNKAYALLSK